MSTLGDLYDYAVTDQDDSAVAIAFTSSDGRLVNVAWMLNSGVVVVGTDSSEMDSAVQGYLASTPITVLDRARCAFCSEGSPSTGPLPMRRRCGLHWPVAATGCIFGKFDAVSEGVQIDELSTRSRGASSRGRRKGIAYQRDPHRVIWARTADGRLIGLSFRPDLQVVGWHTHQ